jgi:hypothetical protein
MSWKLNSFLNTRNQKNMQLVTIFVDLTNKMQIRPTCLPCTLRPIKLTKPRIPRENGMQKCLASWTHSPTQEIKKICY